jgi:hypothetical protein
VKERFEIAVLKDLLEDIAKWVNSVAMTWCCFVRHVVGGQRNLQRKKQRWGVFWIPEELHLGDY